MMRTAFPQIAVGGGWSSDLFIANPYAVSAPGVILSIFGEDGTPMSVDSGEGAKDSFTFDLAAGETKVLNLSSSSGTVRVGYAILRFPASTPSIRATLFVRWKSGGKVVTQLGVAQQSPGPVFTLAAEVESSKGVNTGLALVRLAGGPTEAVAEKVVISLIKEDGSLQATALLSLAQDQHIARLLNETELFPGLDHFRGTVMVAGTVSLGVLALRLEGTVLGSLAINAGPMLGPFAGGGTPSNEQEPNDSTVQAQQVVLPARVSGSINPSSDEDLFSFSGKKGDIIAGFTVGDPNSRIDTILTLLNGTGEQVATNDQNGLVWNNDSFVQACLPADGTYFFRVEDYYYSGGPDYLYTLHLTKGSSGGGQPSLPTISSITPTQMIQGQTGQITIAGTNLSGASQVTVTPSQAITVSNLQSSSTSVSATLQVNAAATTGVRKVAVVTPAGTSNTLDFSVQSQAQPTPTLTSISPGSLTQGQTATVNLFGYNLAQTSQIVVTPSTGVAIAGLVASSGSVYATFQVSSEAASGTRQVSVVSPVGTSNSLSLTIVPALPQITKASPASLKQGQSSNVTITGSGLTGVTQVLFSPAAGISVSGISPSASQVTALITVSTGAATGPRQLSVQTSAGVSNPLNFDILSASATIPQLTSVIPSSIETGHQQSITITGTNLAEVTSVVFSPSDGLGNTILSVGSTEISTVVNAWSDASVGVRQLSVLSPAGASNSLPFSVALANPEPEITDLLPSSGRAGRFVALEIEGDDFDDFQTLSFAPNQGLILSEVYPYPWAIYALLEIDPEASLGIRQVTVTTAHGVSNSKAFEILPWVPGTAPAISNLEVGAVHFTDANNANVNISFDFQDPDGDLFLVEGQPAQSAAWILTSPGCSTRSFSLDRPGVTSGNVDERILFFGYSKRDFLVTLQVRDAEGKLSNPLQFHIEAWPCN